MNSFSQICLIYLAVINLVAFALFGIDKWKAQRRLWRVREASLLAITILGGSVGAWIGMYVWRHKTQHLKFRFGVPMILLAQVTILIIVYNKLQ